MKTEPTVLPGWTWTELDSLIEGFEAGKSPKASGRPAEQPELGVIKVSAVSWGEFRAHENKALLSERDFKASAVVRAGDLLISRANTVELVGNVVLVDEDHPRLMLSDKILRLLVRDELVDRRFLLWSLRTPAVRRVFEADATGTSTSMRNLSQGKIAAAPILLAPLNEQRRIVEKVDALFAHSKKAKASLDRIPALLEKLKKSILAAAFRGDLTKDWREAHPDVEPADKLLDRIRTERRRRWEEAELRKMRAKGKEPKDDRWKQKYKQPGPPDLSGFPPVPRAWAWTTIQAAGELLLGRRVAPEYAGYPLVRKYVRVANVKGGRLDLSDLKSMRFTAAEAELFELQAGDVLLSEGQSRELVGQGAIFRGEEDGLCFQSSLHRFRAYDGILPAYAQLLFASYVKTGVFQRFAAITTNIAHLTNARLRDIAFPVPPAEEQAEIVRTLESGLSHIEATARVQSVGVERLSRLERSVLAKAFRGELVPQDPNDEPASILLERIRAVREAAGPTKQARRGGRGRKKKAAPDPEVAPEPEPTTRAPPAPPPAQPDLPFEDRFLDLGPREQAQAVANALFGAGPLPKADAIRLAADGLRELGLSTHKRLRIGGKLHTALEKAVTNGVRHGLLDRPARGEVRAIKPDAKTWTEADWALVVAAVPPTDDPDAWLREAATWAAENCGLHFKRLRRDGVVSQALRSTPKETKT